VRMNFMLFSVVTILGSALWCFILAYLGDKAYRLQPDLLSDPDGMVRFIRSQSHWIVIFVGIFAFLYFLTLRLTAKRAATDRDEV
jgi:membrane protein DedA with SNARE-associated domain